MKKFVFLALCLFAVLSYAFQNDTITTTPSVKTENPSDSIDLEAQMKVYEGQMKELEQKMKPFEDLMKEKEKEMKPLEKLMKDKERELKNGGDTRKISDDMRKIGDDMGKIGTEMGKIGDKMGVIGNEMSKIGEKMGMIGAAIGRQHQKVFTWFFQELIKEGLIATGENCSIFMEQSVMVVNGKTLDVSLIAKYKQGLEAQLGRPLKTDFSIFFKGTVKRGADNAFDTNGNMNVHF